MTRGVPSNEVREGWWYRASQEDKLRQVDAAINLGFSSRIVAKNCGAEALTIISFAQYHGRTFLDAAEVRAFEREEARPRIRKLSAREERARLRRAYFAGEPVEFGGSA